MRRLSGALLAQAAIASACAQPGMPPGGPEDHAPPEILQVTPDSGATGVRARAIVFQFDEVVSERPGGVPSLDRLFILSPRDGEPRVDWHRRSIVVRPRRGFRPGVAYTVTMLPGLADLRGNVRKEGASVVFSTGATIPAGRVEGVVFDWVAGRPAANGLVLLHPQGDTTLTYVALTDSSGRFAVASVAPGSYVLRGGLDANSNRAIDPREAWDSAVVRVDTVARVEVLAFVHDTIGPRIQTVTVRDSLTLRVAFDRPLHPDRPLDLARFRLQAADSSAVPIARALAATQYDAEQAALAPARPDSARADTARADTARRGAPRPRAAPARDTARADTTRTLRPSRPSPITEVVLILRAPLTPGGSYRLTATDMRGLLGATRTSDRVVTVPKAPARPDSTRADTTRRPVTPPPPARPPTGRP